MILGQRVSFPAGCYSYHLCQPQWPLIRFRPQDESSEASAEQRKTTVGTGEVAVLPNSGNPRACCDCVELFPFTSQV